MARGLTINVERRAGRRVAPASTAWSPSALLRPGQEVALINLSSGGALVESPTRLKPGAPAELQLLGPWRCVVRGRIDRCRVIRLEPLRYEGAIRFDAQLDPRALGSE